MVGETKPVIEEEVQPVVLGGATDFDDAFAEAVEGMPQEPAVTPEEGVPPVLETEPEPAPTPEPEPAPAPEPDTLQNELAALRAELAELKKAPAPAPAPEPEVAPAPEPLYTPEQEKVLADFKKEWPEVSAGVEMMLQGAMKQAQQVITQHIFGALNPALSPVLDYYQTSAVDHQYNEIKKGHPDYDEIYENVLQWVDKQPAYLKTALEHVVAEGSAAEVVDMISRYKQEVGKVVPLAKSAPAVTELPESAKKVARSLGVVSSKRSAVPQSQDPTDFDGAWAEAVNR